MEKGYLRGFFDVYIEPWGLTMSCSYFDKDGKRWVTLPTREYEKDGEKKYHSLVRFDKERHFKFQDKVLELIDKGEYECAPERTPVPQTTTGARLVRIGDAEVDDDVPF